MSFGRSRSSERGTSAISRGVQGGALLALAALSLGADSGYFCEDNSMVAARLSDVAAAFPAFRGMIAAAAPPVAVRSSGETRYRLSPPSADRVSMEPPRRGIAAWDLGRDLSAEVDATGTLRLEDEKGGVQVTVRRGGGGAPTATLDGSAVSIRGAWRGADAFVFTKDRGVEDLVLARESSAVIAYSFDLPPNWHLTSPAATPDLVQILDDRGVARLRFRVGKSLDATGHDVAVRPKIEGFMVRLAIGEAATWPVLIDPEFETTGTLATPRVDHSSTRLPDGRALIAGGRSKSTLTCDVLSSMEVFDPATATFTVLERSMVEPRRWHTATPLPSGEVLFAGGLSSCCDQDACDDATSSLEVFSPITRESKAISVSMDARRYLHTATLVAGGDVLFAGGFGEGTSTIERLSITGGTVSPQLAPMSDVGEGTFRSATWLSGDRVLLEWSKTLSISDEGLSTYEISGMSFGAPNLDEKGVIPARHTATLLPRGEVLFVEASSAPGELEAALLHPKGSDTQGGDPEASAVSTSIDDVEVPAPRNHTATLLPDGRVLLVGGRGVSAAAVYVPASAKEKVPHVTPTAGLMVARDAPQATLLSSGSVLVTGGCLSSNSPGDECGETRASAEVFAPSPDDGTFTDLPLPADPTSEDQTVTPLLSEYRLFVRREHAAEVCTFRGDPKEDNCWKDGGRCWKVSDKLLPTREGHTATLLADGHVLIAGGSNQKGPLASMEVFVPDKCGSLSQLTELSMFRPRARHTATLLPDGRILFLGGEAKALAGQPPTQGDAEVQSVGSDGAANSLFVTGTTRLDHTATLLLDGTVLIAGGVATEGGPRLKSAEIYDPTRRTITKVGDLNYARKSHSATLLPDGRALLVGGTEGESHAEIYNPVTGQFSPFAAVGFPNPRAESRATMLPSGKVLVSSRRDPAESVGVDLAVFDPLTGHVLHVFTPLKQQSLHHHAQALLPDGGVLFYGRDEAPEAPQHAFIWYEPGENHPGDLQIKSVTGCDPTCDVSGCLAGSTDGSSGTTSASSTRLPMAVWMRIPDGIPIAGGLSGFKEQEAGVPCSESAAYRPPPTLLRGPGFLFVNGGNSRSSGAGFSAPRGHERGIKCASDAECASGACVDDHCCESRCDGSCLACDIRGKEGTCAAVTTSDEGEICDGCDTNADCPAGEVCLAPEQEGSTRRRCGPPPGEIGCSVARPEGDSSAREPLFYSAITAIVIGLARRRRGRKSRSHSA